jgi:alpha-glucosidase (family GH31 glycosyl hydrolase)
MWGIVKLIIILGIKINTVGILPAIFTVGNFIFQFTHENNGIKIYHTKSPERVIFSTNGTFIHAGNIKEPHRNFILNGNYREMTTERKTHTQTITSIFYTNINRKILTITGELGGIEMPNIYYNISFYIGRSANQLAYNISAPDAPVVFFSYDCELTEQFYGFGTQYTEWNMKGKRVPIIVTEQGIGRGKNPLSFFANLFEKYSSGGWSSTYAPKALYITNFNNSAIFENDEMLFFDLRERQKVTVEVVSSQLRGNILVGNSPFELIEEITLITGRMKPLPQWTQRGAIVGLEGGTQKVENIIRKIIAHNVTIGAIWLQDWVDIKKTLEGDRLCWCWTLERNHYPGWDDMTQNWKRKHNIRVLTYVNPYFSLFENNTLQIEGDKKGFFVKNRKNESYAIYSGSIKFNMLDTTNPGARRWMINIIKRNMLNETGVSGWMADFGEHLPTDSVLYTGEDALTYHNKYPEEWAKINRDAIREYTEEYISITPHSPPPETLFFMRSSNLVSTKYTQSYWLGDQMVTWDEHDGIKTVLNGFLTAGMSGNTITHSDIGGYTQFSMLFVRSRELLMRWTELSAFGSALFRTHVGSNMSPENAQIYDDGEALAHFSYFTNIFVELEEYRSELMKDAETRGWSLMRPMSFYFENCWQIKEQYMFGREFMVAPVLSPNIRVMSVFFPKNTRWIHLWSETEIEGTGQSVIFSCDIGFIPVFFIKGSIFGERLKKYIHDKKEWKK